MSVVDWFMGSFLYCFPYSYRSSNYCDSKICRSFTLLKALAKSNGILFARKSDNYRYRDRWKSDNFRERAIKAKKQRTDTKKDAKRIKSDNLKGVIVKIPILLQQYCKMNDWMASYLQRILVLAIIFSPTVQYIHSIKDKG